MRGAKLPESEHLAHRAAEPAEQVHLMNRLIDKRSTTFGAPAALHRSSVILGRPIPFDVGVELQRDAHPASSDCGFQEPARFIEPMLTDDAEQNVPSRCRLDHPPRGLEI